MARPKFGTKVELISRTRGAVSAARPEQGFTIVELLIVIIVIAILAAISIVAYNGIQVSAGETVLKSDLANAARQLGITHTEDGNYPSDESSLSKSENTTFQYTRMGDAYCLTATSSRSGVRAFMISSDSTSPREGTCPGHTGPVAGGGGGSDIATNAPIQSVTQAQCQALPTFTGSNDDAVRTVTDERGGTTRTYEIAKLADGKCWMLTNLKLGSTAGPITLTPEDSDVTNDFILPQVMSGGGTHYNDPRVHGPVPGDTGSGSTNYGYLYGWPAATAGEWQNGGGEGSVCARGWRLPTGGALESDFAQLDIAFGGTGSSPSSGPPQSQWLYSGAFKGVLSGYYGGFAQQGSRGYLWAASANSIADSRPYAWFTSSAAYPGDGSSLRIYSFAIRCILG